MLVTSKLFAWHLLAVIGLLEIMNGIMQARQSTEHLKTGNLDPGVQLVTHYYQQRRGHGRIIPDTLDLQDNALLAIHAITSGMDPDAEYRLWFSIYFDRRPLCMRHHEPSEFDQAGKYLEGLTLMRIMTGSQLNMDLEKKLWQFLDNHTKKDGLIYYDTENPNEKPVYAYTQARSLLARICRYELEPNAQQKVKIEQSIDSLLEKKMVRGFGFGPLLPAIRWYRLTGYSKALELAKLDVEALQKKNTFNDDGSFGGHFHSHSGAAIGLLAYGLVTHDKQLVQHVCRIYEFARSKGTDYGYFPEAIPPCNWVMQIGNEGCCTADMTSLAAILSQTGSGDYWDDLGRYLRNQLTEIQMKKTDFIGDVPKENKVTIPIDPIRGETEIDDVKRFIGAFAGWAMPNDFAGSAHFWLQQCCLGNCPRALYQGWQSIVTPTQKGLRINLLLNRSTPEIDIDSWLPYEGKVQINIKKTTFIEVRIPGWVESTRIKVKINGKHVKQLKWDKHYLILGKLKANKIVEISFPKVERKVKYLIPGAVWASKYSIVDEQSGSGMPLPRSVYNTPPEIVKQILKPKKYVAHYLGNTIVDIQPTGTIYPLYQRKEIFDTDAPMQKVNRHIPEKVISNWY